MFDDGGEFLILEVHVAVLGHQGNHVGIPVLEALAAGCPLCLSDIPVFHEIAGDLAAYFDPDSPESAARAFDRALALRSDAGFANLSLARADAFSWKTCTDKVWEIYKELA